MVLACGGLTPAPPPPKGRVIGSNLDSSCSKLFDYCVRMACEIKNEGKERGRFTVRFTVDGSSFSDEGEETLTIDAGDSRVVSHDFPKAKLLDDARSTCEIIRSERLTEAR